MDQEKKPSEPVRLEVEVLVDAIDEIEENEDDVPASEDGRSRILRTQDQRKPMIGD